MDKTPCFLVFLILSAVFVSCCVDQKKTADNSSITYTTSTAKLLYYTLAQTKTTLMADSGNKDSVEEIARLIESGKLDDALVIAEKSARPEVFVYLNNAGVNYTREKKYEEADKVFSSILRAYPNQPDIWYNKGLVDADLGRHEDAVVAFSNATALKPEDSEAWYQKASSLYYLKRYGEAVEACNRSLALKPGNPYAWYNLGIALTELKRFNESINAYDKALAVKPDYAEAENNKGNVLSELGMYKEAIAAYDRALAIRDDNQTRKNRDLAETKLKGGKSVGSQNISLSSQ
jgi:tetratricopeptide (TPR) repeat protein